MAPVVFAGVCTVGEVVGVTVVFALAELGVANSLMVLCVSVGVSYAGVIGIK